MLTRYLEEKTEQLKKGMHKSTNSDKVENI